MRGPLSLGRGARFDAEDYGPRYPDRFELCRATGNFFGKNPGEGTFSRKMDNLPFFEGNFSPRAKSGKTVCKYRVKVNQSSMKQNGIHN